jgi:hypothetical protein
MRRARLLLVVGLLAVGALSALAVTAAASDRDLAAVRAATARYHQIDKAEAAGWTLVEGLDHCFTHPEAGGMGYHHINVDLLDATLDPERPEALVYVPQPSGKPRLGAVEWIVPADAWEAEGHDAPPSVLGRPLHLNEGLGVWVLHAWVFEHNPAGMFSDWNPRVVCPGG